MSTLVRFEASLVPRNLVIDPPMTDAELEAFCARNQDVQIERTRDGVIRVNPPTGLLTSDGNSEIIHQLRNWWEGHRIGRVFDSNAGFFLNDGSLLSPDAAYLLPLQLEGLTKAELARMPHLCPVFVVELLSESDRLAKTQEKMERWIANGADVGWIVDPYRRCVEVYSANALPRIDSSPRIHGSGPVDGFVMDMAKVWRCYEV